MCFAGRSSSPPHCPISCASFVAALKNGHPDCLSYWHMVRQMHYQEGHIWTHYRAIYRLAAGPYICSEAAKMQSVEELMYVHDVLGLPWDADTCEAAARSGSIDCLGYAHASGCPWDALTCATAAAFGRLHCLAYAHEHGCEWSSSTVESATQNGEVECLKYAHTHGCPFTATSPFHWTVSHFWCRPGQPMYLTTEAV